VRTSDSVTKITVDLIVAASKIKHAEKDSANSHFKNSYASLESCIDASKQILLDHNIVVLQAPNGKVLTTRLQHASGEFFESDTDLILSKNDMQSLGSAITYARRQSLTAFLNMSQADDDGNIASKKKEVKVVTKKPDTPAKDSLPF